MLRAISQRRWKSIEVTAKTFWGERMQMTFPDMVSVSLYQYHFFEEGLTQIMLKYLKPGATFFDVGGHFGYFTLLGSRLVGDRGHVHTFEPTPRTFGVLSRNVAGHTNVSLNQLAVYSHEATLTFTDFADMPSFNTLGNGNFVESERAALKAVNYDVKAISLDRYIETTGARPDVIKLDAEGAEQHIFNGMERTFAEIRPVITLEVGDVAEGDLGKSRSLVEFALSKGYDALEYNTQSKSLEAHRLKDTRYEYDNILLVPKR